VRSPIENKNKPRSRVQYRLLHANFHSDRCRDGSIGPKNGKIYEIGEYNRPHGRIRCAILIRTYRGLWIILCWFHVFKCGEFRLSYGVSPRGGATGKAFGLTINRSRVQILLEVTLRNNLGQVVHTYVPLSPSSITWYRPKGGDALRLGR